MANVSRPRGLSPVGTVTGAAYNEQGQLFAVANDATNTYAIGDIVTYAGGSDTNGIAYVTKMTADTSLPLGVIVGIRPADPGVSLQGTNINLGQLYISLNSGSYTYVYVITDPAVVTLETTNSLANFSSPSLIVPTGSVSEIGIVGL